MINKILLAGDSEYLLKNVQNAIKNNYNDLTIKTSLEGASAFYECLTDKPDLIVLENTIDNMQVVPNISEFDKNIKLIYIIEEDMDVLRDLPYGVDGTIIVNSSDEDIIKSLSKFIDKQ